MRDNGLVMLMLALVVVRAIVCFAGGRAAVAGADAWITRVDLRVWPCLLFAWMLVRNLPGFWYLGLAR